MGVGVLVDDEAVPVERDAAGVPALAGRGLEALAGLHHQLVVVAAGDADVDVAQHDGAEGLLQRLVGGTKAHPRLAQLLLHPERDRGIPRQRVRLLVAVRQEVGLDPTPSSITSVDHGPVAVSARTGLRYGGMTHARSDNLGLLSVRLTRYRMPGECRFQSLSREGR